MHSDSMDGAHFSALSGWPVNQSVYLTLDLERDFGTALREHSYRAVRETDELANLLNEYGVPLTCFLQTAVLEKAPAAVESLRRADVPVEFQPHSHSHPRRAEGGVKHEVEKSVALIRQTFDTDPLGYRFPDGAARLNDFEILADNDIEYDASSFPTFRPGRFNNLSRAIVPEKHHETGIVELPFSVYSGLLRIPVSLSYLKFIGRPFEQLVLHRPPSVIVFNLHMHDLILPSSYDSLAKRYKLVYARRANDGYDILRRFINRMDELGYRFGTMSELYQETGAAFEGLRPNRPS